MFAAIYRTELVDKTMCGFLKITLRWSHPPNNSTKLSCRRPSGLTADHAMLGPEKSLELGDQLSRSVVGRKPNLN